MHAFDWCQNQRPWMTLKGHYTTIHEGCGCPPTIHSDKCERHRHLYNRRVEQLRREPRRQTVSVCRDAWATAWAAKKPVPL